MPPPSIPSAPGPPNANTTSFSSPSASASAPRRRPRVDSDSDPEYDPDSAAPRPAPTSHSKRPRSENYTPSTAANPAANNNRSSSSSNNYYYCRNSSSSSTAAPAAMSAKVQGKRPEVIDLTNSPTDPTPNLFAARHSHPHYHHHQPRPALQPHLGSRKLVVKNLRPAGGLTIARIHADLDAALSSIFAGRPTSQPMERLYRG
ncbi:hypothetical protein VTH06DRAFT_8832, partial [Thermothelomyces fergusii]